MQLSGPPGRFQSTPPARGATRDVQGNVPGHHDFNPRPPRGGRLHHRRRRTARHLYFNPRPPRGGRQGRNLAGGAVFQFQSTPPARGATLPLPGTGWNTGISIHAPREGGDLARSGGVATLARFQSTPPARGATVSIAMISSLVIFQSTPPARGATWPTITKPTSSGISIHAPREGGDSKDAQFYL